jgi:hypothetical protein
MPPYADIYVLTQSRTEATVLSFLDRFAPIRAETADEYCIPQYADSAHIVFRAAAEVVSYCCRYTSETQSIYWRRAGDGGPAYAMVFFTSDGFLILGLSTEESAVERYFAELLTHAGSDVGYVTVESPPPDNSAEFRKFASSLPS